METSFSTLRIGLTMQTLMLLRDALSQPVIL
jgi:hypothetical protein